MTKLIYHEDNSPIITPIGGKIKTIYINQT